MHERERFCMAHRDPQQEVINTLSRFLTPSARVTPGQSHLTLAENELTRTRESFRFLRTRTIASIPGRMIIAAVNTLRAPDQLQISFLIQNRAGDWCYSGGASTSLGGKSTHPRINLGGGGWPFQFHAGGYVVNNGYDITHVHLLSRNGTICEDEVDNDIVLFFTDEQVEIPLLAELYDREGNLVSAHNVFGN